MKRTQPQGPYVIAGYSYGGAVAFEMAKVLLQQDGPNAVPFLAVFDQPPHIKQRMRHGRDWVGVLLTLVRFFNLLPDAESEASFRRAAAMPYFNAESGAPSAEERERLVELLLQHRAVDRLEEYGLDKKRLARWTSLALNSHAIARDYEPSGQVPVLEVFYGEPHCRCSSLEGRMVGEEAVPLGRLRRRYPVPRGTGPSLYSTCSGEC